MAKTRRKHSAQFKTQVVLEMLQGEWTLSELSSKHGVHPTQLTKWRRKFLDNAWEIFSEKSSAPSASTQLESELYK